MSNEEIRKQIEDVVEKNKIVVFMKGTKEMPRCGFSAKTVDCFSDLGVSFEGINVLEDPEFRSALTTYSNWPTIPQVFIDGKFVGGCDITCEMHQTGELRRLVDEALSA